MLKSTLRAKVIRAAAGITAASLAIGASMIGGTTAGADPKQFAALTGVGSDTTQDVMNAIAGFTSGLNYTPAQSSTASGQKQVASWDALGTTCITTKTGSGSFLRPNGSSNGRKALSRAIDGGTWPASTPDCGGVKPTSGLVDFARSSSPPSGTGTDLTYIPFGRDGLSFGYYRSSGSPVTTLTSAQLTSLFSTGEQTIGGVAIVPCGIQTQSGTYGSWNTALGITSGQESTGTAACTTAGTGARLQENDGNGLKAKGDSAALLGKQVIVGFSAANFISQSNGAVTSQLPSPFGTVDLGAIDALGKPYTGTPPNVVASSTFYASTVFGRDVYNVVPSTVLDPPANANADFKTLFVGTSSAVCSKTTTITAFGFLGLGASCGATTLKGPLLAN